MVLPLALVFPAPAVLFLAFTIICNCYARCAYQPQKELGSRNDCDTCSPGMDAFGYQEQSRWFCCRSGQPSACHSRGTWTRFSRTSPTSLVFLPLMPHRVYRPTDEKNAIDVILGLMGVAGQGESCFSGLSRQVGVFVGTKTLRSREDLSFPFNSE
ncbi:uncharacterized protein ANIA_09139 [Aspergillus nidulans FGSC A4]|uniref:Uncharacterized protein n=1 Tax=Emericella nidulans (strain FGSC A4 / ATCC 38163 / CBS 112.46 / NRRL 194 / M139) TaxID=227321 RepID=C8VK60_EMENI|nr:hypothetical protein [Aspergillus nidulans FGSC A4]CBF82469.1 TPA: hypothetical protein ANIA_09139 [Aspergillus nidulans FGSC A4]